MSDFVLAKNQAITACRLLETGIISSLFKANDRKFEISNSA